jgi:GT2 family glycosyltransferase
MARTPAVSVVISTFNRSEFLAASLEAFAVQRVSRSVVFDVTVVDNNSSDDTKAVVSRFASAIPGRYRYVFEPRQGVSHGRNAGISATRAPIVAFTDDDNVVDPDWIATLVSAFDRHPEVAAIGGRVLPEWPAPPPAWLDRRHWAPLAILDYGDRCFYASSADPRCLLTANLGVRRKVFSQLGHFSPDFPRCQDHEFQIRLWRAGARVLYAPELVVRARISPERLTRRYHQTWHTTHGVFMSLIRFEEIIDHQGRLLPAPIDAPRLYGTPAFVYRAMGQEAGQCALAALRFDRASTADCADRVRYFVSYIRHNARTRPRPGGRQVPLSDPMGFVRAHVARRLKGAAISIRRATLVHLLLVALVGASAYDIRTGKEHWPFSPYPMFSNVERAWTLDGLRLFGVTDEATPREIPLLESDLIAPFDQARLAAAFGRTYNDPQRRPLIAAMLNDCLERYERRRNAGQHEGPALRAIRLYDVHWTLDPHARNVDTPDRRRLIAQIDRATPFARKLRG